MSNLSKAVFLDRDGVINRERSDYVKTVLELEIFPDVAPKVKILKDKGFLVVVITNQSAVNRGLTTHKNINDIHSEILDYFKKEDVLIDAIYYCPHRPDENCTCRKPKPGLLLHAARDLNIDLTSSWMIGNNDSDIKAATSVGCQAIKIDNDTSLLDAVQRILNSLNL